MGNPFPKSRRIWILSLIVSLLAGYSTSSNVSDAIEAGDLEQPNPDALSIPMEASMEPIYSQVVKQWREQGARDAAVPEIRLSAADFKNAAEDVAISDQPLEGKSDTVSLEEKQWVEYEIDVPQSGLYQLRLHYYSLNDSNIPIQIAVTIDGLSPYVEANNIKLDRVWKDGQFPPKLDDKNNQIRPEQVEVKGWLDRALTDSSYASSEPLRWYLEQGKRVVRIESVFEPIAIYELALQAPQSIAPYVDVSSGYTEANPADEPDWYTTIETERMAVKSEPSVQMQASRDDLASPKSNGKIVFNTMGGNTWFRGGQSATWSFEVPEDGLYKIDLKYYQGYIKGTNSYRQIAIDGKVPFHELEAFPFPYNRNWSMISLERGKGDPFLFQLAKGKHELTLTVTNAPVTPIVESIQYMTKEIQEINRLVRLITGSSKDNLDKNRDWDIVGQLPDIEQRFLAMKGRLEQILNYMKQLYGNEAVGAAAVRDAIDKLQRLADDPNELPFKPEYLSSVQESLSAYAIELRKQPLMLDQIYVSKATADLPNFAPSTWEIIKNTIKTFFLTFSPDYIDYGRQDKDAAITVWVNRGRDYVTLMQQMVDEQFSASTGIKVNVNIMPNPQLLLLSNAAGREPDVALGLDQLTPVDFAIRGALMDLNRFPDYKEAAEQFLPGTLLPFHYNKGDYALPETIMFNVMFYRKDILEELKLEAPETWDDIYTMLPTLQQKGYDFFYQPMMYLPLFYQHNASFYTPDGMKSGLDSPQAFDAFKKWTDLFNIYGLPREVPNFYMHFRNGDIPIGVADFNTYLQLLVAAPEISGLWSVAPLPGIRNDEGVVERWGGGSLQSGVIFKSTERPEEAWKFLKWWTSAETQTRFGNDMEMFNGIEFRWNTANQVAFKRISWPSEHSSEIVKQLQWFKEMPNVPGGYFTARELNFAWNRTVLENMNFRESLENAIFEINRELLRKQQEFGFVDKDGKVVRTLDIPQIEQQTGGKTNNEQ